MSNETIEISPRIVVNGEQRGAPGDGRLPSLLADLGVDLEHVRGIAVAVNDEVVRRRDWDEVRLSDGDRVEVVTAKQGG